MLVHLVVKNASVRVLQFRLVHQLLLELLLGMQLTSLVLMDFICLFLLLLLLFGHREGAHVLRINLILLIYSSFLGGQVSLLVYVEWVIRYFRVYAFTMRATSTWVTSWPSWLVLYWIVPETIVGFHPDFGQRCISCSIETLQRLSDQTVAQVFHATNTVENINSAFVNSTSEHLSWLFWSLLLVMVINFNWILIVNARCTERLSDMHVVSITFLAWLMIVLILKELAFTCLNSHQPIDASLVFPWTQASFLWWCDSSLWNWVHVLAHGTASVYGTTVSGENVFVDWCFLRWTNHHIHLVVCSLKLGWHNLGDSSCCVLR